MNRRVWIARNPDPLDSYGVFLKKPKRYKSGYIKSPNLCEFCQENFEEITGFKLEPGKERRVEIKINEI